MRWIAVWILEWLYDHALGDGQAYRGRIWWAASDWLEWAIAALDYRTMKVKDGSMIRWRIATQLDRFRDVCWAKVGAWAAYPELDGWSELQHMRHTAGACARHGETPYCGKCGVTGLHQEIEWQRKQSEMRANIDVAQTARRMR